MKIRTLFLIWWTVLLGCFAAILATGCGDVTAQLDDAAAPDATQTSHDGGELEAPEGTMVPIPDAGPEVKPAPTCAAFSSPPYCGSCRDARGVCYCGALPCCDQHCQS